MEFINDFLYLVIKPFNDKKHIYCSGVNITKFSPITKGRHRLGQNPAEKGLQSLNNDIRALVISNNAIPETIKSLSCPEVNPLKEDLWYTEAFLIHNYSEALGEKIKIYAPSELIRKMFKAMLINETVPEGLSPQELQEYLYRIAEVLSVR
ncbi:MAG: hypothetical protein N3A00_02945 [Thermodesulfovibrio sp.]|nr:hypothetical protein [Thermodesulfovibrio sp.]